MHTQRLQARLSDSTDNELHKCDMIATTKKN